MPASVLTFFLNNPIQSGSSAGLLDTTAPPASTSTTGFTPGTISTTFSFATMQYNLEEGSAYFTGGGPGAPVGPPTQSAHSFAIDCWRTNSVYTGVFSAGTWYSSASVISVTAGLSGAGNLRWRIWRSSSFSGASATEITKFSNNSCLIGSTFTNLTTTVAQSSSASTQVASFSVSGEYLFLSTAYQIRTASGNASADVLFRMGPITDLTNGSHLVTSAFSDTTPTSGGVSGAGFYVHRKHWGAA